MKYIITPILTILTLAVAAVIFTGYLLLSNRRLLFLLFLPFFAAAQPTDATTPPPTAAPQVNKVVPPGTITLTASDSSAFDTVDWYKLDSLGNGHLSTITGAIYTEQSLGPGRYKYMARVHKNGCISAFSNIEVVDVVPALVTSISSVSTACIGTGFTLTASAPPAKYAYTYQWTRNGVVIPGATGASYAALETGAGTVTYGCVVAYTILPGYTSTPLKSVVVSNSISPPVIR